MNLFTSLFQQQSINKIGFEFVKSAIQHPSDYYIINTLPLHFQDCLIATTVSYLAEEKLINDLLSSYNSGKKTIVIYGLNSQDVSAEMKYKQLISLGLENVCLYSGGFFEWTLLQDIYGKDQFPTTSRVVDLLRGQTPK
jgi:hypothetical protein